ncbi:(4Fe-4S)-binding protein [Tunicatimonas pelagia]|uniref:(4Fe-4S)-binding protein n=1 Tax=Tunicatimonas pelagia TaxID=931531 RepID=UPI00266561A8|nr:(4Fe-4S)-binding protein [Tunicatimonas pelagia]WKN44826.1 (4Fe-4S)-binding protein [Tunicatimonas pelagia]
MALQRKPNSGTRKLPGVDKKYTHGAVTVRWQSARCIHAGVCVRRLPGVFRPKEKPWVRLENASAQEVIDTVALCPSQALSTVV